MASAFLSLLGRGAVNLLPKLGSGLLSAGRTIGSS
jgi:hypothetical protein